MESRHLLCGVGSQDGGNRSVWRAPSALLSSQQDCAWRGSHTNQWEPSSGLVGTPPPSTPKRLTSSMPVTNDFRFLERDCENMKIKKCACCIFLTNPQRLLTSSVWESEGWDPKTLMPVGKRKDDGLLIDQPNQVLVAKIPATIIQSLDHHPPNGVHNC